MQPYLFPYIGYFQLINSVDKFVIYKDVAFIKQGWINRNNILSAGKTSLFTVPLQDASSYKLIKDTRVNDDSFPKWKEKFYRTLEVNYAKAPYFSEIFALVKNVLDKETNSISELAEESVISVCSYLGMKTNFSDSANYQNGNLKGKDRVIDICKKENADIYINAIGGKELYSKDEFKENNIELFFLSPAKVPYKQLNDEFTPWLSIIDVLMFNSKEAITGMLTMCELV